ncbi:MAG: Phytochrome-like protein cph2 [Betaproteobacteria bacterium ADurb.Bin341]|nr:MAG: Phytochrome-like protein cph2 [Betaproteobacteria bacterium ADurb.Bin341]
MSDDLVTLLMVEDNAGDLRLVEEMLLENSGARFRLLHADKITSAIPILDKEKVDIILLDLTLPDTKGLDTLVKMHALSPGLPIVVLSCVEDESLAIKAVRLGAQDFLVKSHINPGLLARSLHYALERRQLEEHLYHLAHHDPLTDLPNRRLFYERLSRALASSRRHQLPLALMLIDLNGFKQINDTYGHKVGDGLLIEAAKRMTDCLRATDCVARLGGDEYIIFISDLGDTQQVARVAQKILQALEAPCTIDGNTLRVYASMGIALFPGDGEEMETLVQKADSVMYVAKSEKKAASNYRFFSSDIHALNVEHKALEESLKGALERGEFQINYQPQFDLHSGRLIGMEALLRWRQPNGEETLPARFLPVLEESGLIVSVGEWVLKTVCRQNKAWQEQGFPPVTVAVNISPRQFRDKNLPENVDHALKASGLNPRLLELELSEDSLREDEQFALELLKRLNSIGVRLALDNYGAGSTSLRYLQRFPIHTVKIDRSIVRDVTSNPEEAAIVRAVIAIAHVFKMKGIAQGVETMDQANFLREHACDDAQGYAFGKPLSVEAFTEFLRASSSGKG